MRGQQLVGGKIPIADIFHSAIPRFEQAVPAAFDDLGLGLSPLHRVDIPGIDSVRDKVVAVLEMHASLTVSGSISRKHLRHCLLL